MAPPENRQNLPGRQKSGSAKREFPRTAQPSTLAACQNLHGRASYEGTCTAGHGGYRALAKEPLKNRQIGWSAPGTESLVKWRFLSGNARTFLDKGRAIIPSAASGKL